VINVSEGFQMGQSRKLIYAKEAEKVNCKNYSPCPVCFKCTVRGVHLYEQCTRCQIPLCWHSQKDREHLIRPQNFTTKAEGVLGDDLTRTYEEYLKEQGGR